MRATIAVTIAVGLFLPASAPEASALSQAVKGNLLKGIQVFRPHMPSAHASQRFAGLRIIAQAAAAKNASLRI